MVETNVHKTRCIFGLQCEERITILDPTDSNYISCGELAYKNTNGKLCHLRQGSPDKYGQISPRSSEGPAGQRACEVSTQNDLRETNSASIQARMKLGTPQKAPMSQRVPSYKRLMVKIGQGDRPYQMESMSPACRAGVARIKVMAPDCGMLLLWSI